MKSFASVVRVLALTMGALATPTQSCEEADPPSGHYHGSRYDDHPRYTPDQRYSESGHRRPDAYEDGDHLVYRRGGDDQDEDRQTSIVLPGARY